MLWFGSTLWPSLILCAVLSLLDYYLTVAGARLYKAGANKMIIFEGSYELTPRFQADIDQLRWFSKRFIWTLVRMLAFVSLLWWLTVQAKMPHLFSLYLGLIVGLELAVQKRHLQNLYLFGAITTPGAVDGQIKYSRSLILKQSAFEMLTFTGLFAVLAVLTWSLFLLGGAIGCASVSIRHLVMARKKASKETAVSSGGA